MIAFRKYLVIDDSQVKDGPADHGKVIGYIYEQGNVVIEAPVPESIPPEVARNWFHDGWIRITKPAPWMQTGKAGWIEYAALALVTAGTNPERKRFILEIGGDDPPTITPL